MENVLNLYRKYIPAITSETARRNIIPNPWTERSRVMRRLFLFVKRLANAMTLVDTRRPPSRAGNGRILRTQRLIERRAMIENMIFQVTHTETTCVNVDPIPIGPDSISVASRLSVGVCGAMSFCTVLPSTSKVI